jgi:hypothetical protein
LPKSAVFLRATVPDKNWRHEENVMREVDALFLVEHVDRELDAVTCIVEILRRDYSLECEVRNFYSDMLYCLSRYRPTVLVTPFFYSSDIHPMKDYLATWPNAAVFNMAWEQILYTMNKTVKIPKDDFAKTKVSHVCWTAKYLDFIKSMGVDRERLILAGNPVMKFYDSPYHRYFISREELGRRYNLDPHRKWVLFPENYRWGFLTESQLRIFVEQGADPNFLREARDYCVRSLTNLFEWSRDLDQAGDPILILRPRPATARHEVQAFMTRVAPEASQRIRIIKTESAREWILAADQVISSYSTTLIEASLAEKPVHVFSPEPIPQALGDEWYSLVPAIENKEKLLAALRQFPADETWRPLAGWARQTLLSAGDPFHEIAAAIARSISGRQIRTRTSPPAPGHGRLGGRQWIIERSRKALQMTQLWHKVLHRKDRRYRFHFKKHEKDVFGADDVAVRLARWASVVSSSESHLVNTR